MLFPITTCRFGPGVSNHGLTREIENIDEEMDILDDEDEMETDENFAKHSNNIYLQECRVVSHKSVESMK